MLRDSQDSHTGVHRRLGRGTLQGPVSGCKRAGTPLQSNLQSIRACRPGQVDHDRCFALPRTPPMALLMPDGIRCPSLAVGRHNPRPDRTVRRLADCPRNTYVRRTLGLTEDQGMSVSLSTLCRTVAVTLCLLATSARSDCEGVFAGVSKDADENAKAASSAIGAPTPREPDVAPDPEWTGLSSAPSPTESSRRSSTGAPRSQRLAVGGPPPTPDCDDDSSDCGGTVEERPIENYDNQDDNLDDRVRQSPQSDDYAD